jgi:hypothetical protein
MAVVAFMVSVAAEATEADSEMTDILGEVGCKLGKKITAWKIR